MDAPPQYDDVISTPDDPKPIHNLFVPLRASILSVEEIIELERQLDLEERKVQQTEQEILSKKAAAGSVVSTIKNIVNGSPKGSRSNSPMASRKIKQGGLIEVDTVNLAPLINDKGFSDITLSVDGHDIFCHKAILSARCKYFAKVFATNKAASILKLTVQYPAALALVNYIYSGSFSLQSESLEELYILSEVYELPELQRLLSEQLGSKASVTLRSKTLGRATTVRAFETEKVRETRKKIALEILETERSYVKSLELINTTFLIPLKKTENDKKPILTKDQTAEIFCYWDVILKCHVLLLRELESRMKDWDIMPDIGDIFDEKVSFIKLYKHYVNNYENSWRRLNEMKKTNKPFREMLKKCDSQLLGLDLQGYLIMPIQRVPRYVLLLQDLSKYTVKSHPDYAQLKKALENMKDLADFINANKSVSDHMNVLQKIQDGIKKYPQNTPLAMPHRKLLKEGVLVKGNGDKVKAFVFSDLLLWCKLKGKRLEFLGLVNLATSEINTMNASKTKLDFELISTAGKFYFGALQGEKESWINLISASISISKERLLGSAFGGTAGTGKQFQLYKEEERKTKRSQLALQLRQEEEKYTNVLKNIVEMFIKPIQEASESNYTLLSRDDSSKIFLNIQKMEEYHSSFTRQLVVRVSTWDDSAKLGDLYLQQVVDCSKVYAAYTSGYEKSISVLIENLNNNVPFMTFMVQTESQHKVSLPDLLETPLKKMSAYYLRLQELFQYTKHDHPDKETLSIIISRLQEFIEQHQQNRINSLKGLSSAKKKSPSGRQRSASQSLGAKRDRKGTPSLDSLWDQKSPKLHKSRSSQSEGGLK